MPTATCIGPAPTAPGWELNDAFLDLICGDEELLHAEFDAIVTAEWADPPPPVHVRCLGVPHPADARCGAWQTSPSAHAQTRHLGTDGWARPRSPPDARLRPVRRRTRE